MEDGMTTLRVVHYMNQFFAGIGAEDKADTPPGQRTGPIGPGRILAQTLGDRGQIVATVYCGDNYMAEKPAALDEVLEMIASHQPHVVIAGPAFSAGRYGVACGEGALATRQRLPVTAVSRVHAGHAGPRGPRTKRPHPTARQAP